MPSISAMNTVRSAAPVSLPSSTTLPRLPPAALRRIWVFRGENRDGRRGRATLVELAEREAHERVAAELRALADELPGLAGRAFTSQLADRVVDVWKELAVFHSPSWRPA